MIEDNSGDKASPDTAPVVLNDVRVWGILGDTLQNLDLVSEHVNGIITGLPALF